MGEIYGQISMRSIQCMLGKQFLCSLISISVILMSNSVSWIGVCFRKSTSGLAGTCTLRRNFNEVHGYETFLFIHLANTPVIFALAQMIILTKYKDKAHSGEASKLLSWSKWLQMICCLKLQNIFCSLLRDWSSRNHEFYSLNKGAMDNYVRKKYL